MLHQIFDFRAELLGQAISGSVGNIDDRGAGLDHSFDHTGKILVVGAACILGVELHILNILLCVSHGTHCALDNLFTRGIELVSDVLVGSADTGVDAGVFGIFKSLGGYLYIIFNGTCQRADSGPSHSL